VTAGLLEAEHAGDGDQWLELCRRWDVIGDQLIAGLLTPFPPLRAMLAGLPRLPKAGGMDLVRMLLTPVADRSLWPFAGDGARLLLAGNGGHSDIPLDAPGSGLMGLLMTMLGQTIGFPVPEGGAGRLSGALAARLRALGGEIRCGVPARRIVVEHGRAVAVEAADGTRVTAGRAVVAAVVAPLLYGALVDGSVLPVRVRRGMRRFQWDPGTVKVDWALSGPVPWQVAPAYAPGTVHVSDDLPDMSASLGQVSSGLVPARPFLLVGQMTTSDPTRSPEGTESMWAYTHVPREVAGDAGDEGISGRWDHDECERFADRIQARIEARAPGFGSRVLARRVLGPHELESRNANLVGGSLNGGTSQLHQQLVFRPVPGSGRAETGIKGLYLGSASAHPGGGVHGAAGMNAARAALAHHRVRRLARRG
jgi:phytoene dehydrogenase-like protein